MPGEILRLSDSQTLEIVRSDRDVLAVTSTWAPGTTRPLMHWHPHQHERFEVISGELTVEIGGEAPRARFAGEAFEVPPRTPHRMWNAGSEPASALWTVTPGLRTEAMFRNVDRGAAGLRKIWLLVRFRNEFRIGRRGSPGRRRDLRQHRGIVPGDGSGRPVQAEGRDQQ